MPTGYPYYVIEPRSGGYRALFFGANDKLVWWTQIYNHRATAQEAIDFARNHGASAVQKN